MTKPTPFLQSCRNNAISQINSVLKESKLNSSDLDFVNQNWENEINQTENLIKIMDVQNRVLDDIQKKKKKPATSQQSQQKIFTTVLITGTIMIILSLILVLVNYYWKKNGKRK